MIDVLGIIGLIFVVTILILIVIAARIPGAIGLPLNLGYGTKEEEKEEPE